MVDGHTRIVHGGRQDDVRLELPDVQRYLSRVRHRVQQDPHREHGDRGAVSEHIRRQMVYVRLHIADKGHQHRSQRRRRDKAFGRSVRFHDDGSWPCQRSGQPRRNYPVKGRRRDAAVYPGCRPHRKYAR